MTPKYHLLRKIARRASKEIKLYNELYPNKPIYFHEVSQEMLRLHDNKRKKKTLES